MSKHGFAIVSLLAITAALLAQPPMGGSPALPAPGSGGEGRATLRPALDPNDRLDGLLMKWEQAMTGVESIYVKNCVRTDKDKKAGSKVYEGEARYLKPNLAALRMIRQDNSNIYELYVCTGPYLYEYRPEFKKLSIHELDQPKAGTFNNNFLQFLFGMTAADAKSRYDLKLAKDVSADNPHYIYLDIQPRFSDDKREFTRAQMVLFASSMLPRRLWFEHPNGNEVLWDLPNFDTSIKLKAADFRPPETPKGWETIRVPRVEPASGVQPRIVRPASK
jgi:TIGR03009 family protein